MRIDRLANELRIEGRPRVNYEHRQGVTAGIDGEKILKGEIRSLGSLRVLSRPLTVTYVLGDHNRALPEETVHSDSCTNRSKRWADT